MLSSIDRIYVYRRIFCYCLIDRHEEYEQTQKPQEHTSQDIEKSLLKIKRNHLLQFRWRSAIMAEFHGKLPLTLCCRS